jgi:hypothetical protein
MAMLLAAGIGAAGTIGGALIGRGGGGGTVSDEFIAQREALTRATAARQEVEAKLGADIARQQSAATEAARLGLFTGLGDVGTYEERYEDFARRRAVGGRGLFTGAAAGAGDGLFRDVTLRERIREVIPEGGIKSIEDEARRLGVSEEYLSQHPELIGHLPATRFEAEAKGKILDVEKFLGKATTSRQFRMMSRLTAEADQMIRREGPMWEQMNQSVLGGIYEGSAAMHRENMKTLSDSLARGGTARRAGLAALQSMRAAESNNRQRQQALWQGKLAIEQWSRDNARTQLGFNQMWVGNHEGVRDKFSGMMNNLATFYGRTIYPSAVQGAANVASTSTKLIQLANTRSTQQDGVGDIVSGLSSMIFGGALKSMFAGPGGTSAPPMLTGSTPGAGGGGGAAATSFGPISLGAR